MATQGTTDVTLDEIEEDQEDENALAFPSTPADDIEIEEVMIDEIEDDQEEDTVAIPATPANGIDNVPIDVEEEEAKKTEEEEEGPTQAMDDDDDDDDKYGLIDFSFAEELILDDMFFSMASEEEQELDHFRHAKYRKLLRDEKEAKYFSRQAVEDLSTYKRNYKDAEWQLDFARSALNEAVDRVQVSADKAAALTERCIALAVQLGILPAPSPKVVTKPAESAEIKVGMDQSSSGSRVWSTLKSFMTKQK